MFHGTFQRTLLAWLFCASCVASLVAAEAGSGEEQPYCVTRWTTDQGLPQNRISCLKQTRDGYLWLGTWFGLARFDGTRFTVFDKFNTPELVDDTINALAEDSDGTLWIATIDGLVSYREHRFHRFTKTDGLPDQRIDQLAACRAGGLWLQPGNNSVMRLKDGKFSRVWELPYSTQRGIQTLQEGADGSLHIVMEMTWLTLSPDAVEPRTNQVKNSSQVRWVRGLAAKQPGRFWVTTRQGGLQCWDQGVSKTVAADQLGQGLVDFIYEDHSTNLWVNVQPGGLFREDRDRWTAVDLRERAGPVSTHCMEEDQNGNLWLGTDQGLIHLRKRQVRAYTTRDGLAGDQVWSVCEGTDGTMWVGTQRGLSCIQNGGVAPLRTIGFSASATNFSVMDSGHYGWPSHELDYVRCVWPSRDGGVRIAKIQSGVFELTDKLKLMVSPDALPDRQLAALYQDRLGRLWVGTGNGVAVVTDGQVTAAYTNWAGRSGYDVRCILEDRAGTFWFGTQGQGLTRLRNGTFEVFTKREGLCNDHVWAIYEDAEGTLWLGTENGLMRYRQGRFFSFARKEGLLEDTINWILEDDFGSLWLSGLRGIYRIERQQLNDVAEGRLASVQVASFGTADGMESNETNGEGQPAGWKARDGRLWFPTTCGVVVIDPKTIEVNEAPPLVTIEQVKADDQVIYGDGLTRSNPKSKIQNPQFHLPPGRAQLLEITYTANTFADPRHTRFRYRLVGREADWRDETTARVAYYTNLRPGNYRFEVLAANHYGVWSPTPAVFTFSLAPHFYETWPFYFLCAAAAIVLAAGVQTYRLRWQRRLLKLDEQHALATERARIARDLHDDLGTALTGLALELDVIGRESKESPPVAEHLGATAQRTRGLAERMREVVWTINPECDTLSSLASFLEQQISQFLGATDVRVRLDFPEDIPALPLAAEARHQLALTMREALTNVVRHAQATEVVVTLAIVSQTLIVRVKDNGRGFQAQAQSGHGLDNMHTRLKQIGGSFECVSMPGSGTVIEFRLPLNPTTPQEKFSG